jgi:hypothetical protein
MRSFRPFKTLRGFDRWVDFARHVPEKADGFWA